MGGGLSNWIPLERHIGGTMPTVAVELPWHGRSMPQQPCRIADDVVTLVADTAFRAYQGTYVAVGHSLGGSIAMGLAALAPERVTNVVLVAGHLFSLAELISGQAARDRALRIALWRALLTASMPMPRPIRAGLTRSRWLRSVMLPPFINPTLISRQSRLGDSLADHTGRGSRRIYRLSRTVALDNVVRRCPAPITIVAGSRDPLLRPADIERARNLASVREYIVIPDCAHWVLVERPQALAHLLRTICRLSEAGPDALD